MARIGGWDDTASAMHTTAIIIVRRRKEGETTANKRGWRDRLVWRNGDGKGGKEDEGGGGREGRGHACGTQWNVLSAGFGFKVASVFINFIEDSSAPLPVLPTRLQLERLVPLVGRTLICQKER